MAEKVSTLIVELATHECKKCSDKIQKVVYKLQDKERISNVNLDIRKSTVTISGSFDTTRVSYKLWHKAGKAIKSIEIAAEEKKTPEEESEKKPDEKKKKKKKNKNKNKNKNPGEPEPETREWRLMICRLCYPLRCNDPSHYYQQHYGCPTPQRPSYCRGPSYCGGACGGSSCTGAGAAWPPTMQMMQQRPAAIGCPGGGCKGCNGCRIVQEGRFIYEEYPPSGATSAASCTIM